MKAVCILAAMLVLLGGAAHAGKMPEQFSSGRAIFRVQCGNRLLTYDVESVAVMPSQTLRLQVKDTQDEMVLVEGPQGHRIPQTGRHTWIWQAPAQPGDYLLNLRQPGTGQAMAIRVFVMEPFQASRETMLRNYRIGRYPGPAVLGSVTYRPPRGLIELTAANRDLRISPHFTLGQFACKQSRRFPQYLVLDPNLVHKCERLLETLNRAGYPCRTLTIMSGFRTPDYNRRLGNVRFSSHVWGRAADVFVDEDGDGMMDDLNRDGRRDYLDAAVLYKIVDRLERDSLPEDLIGGLGLYMKNRHHGPFVHLDVRGKKARWGISVEKPARAGK